MNSEKPQSRKAKFYQSKTLIIDYKDINFLKKFISPSASIDSPRKTGANPKHQRELSKAIKRARHLALISYIPS